MSQSIPVTTKDTGTHGDHWAGIFGFQKFFDNTDNVQNLVMEFAEFAGEQYKSTPADVYNIPLADDLFATVVLEQGEFKTVFPLIFNERAIKTVTQKVEEWSHTGGKEAQILAEGADTYLLDHFATDYAARKEEYKGTAEHNTVLSGILYNATKPTEIEGFSEDFTGFLPHGDYPGTSLYQFRGLITEVRKCANADLYIDGYILTLKLADGNGDKDLCVDAFLSFDNIQTDTAQKGNYISGVLWLQGRLPAQ